MTAAGLVELVVRCGLVMLFLPFSAADKIFGFGHAVGQARQVFKPYPLAAVVLCCGLAIEVFCSIGVVSGFADRASALVFAGYCAATAVLYKQFWAVGDFRVGPDSEGRGLFWDFLKNLSLGAGFLLIVVGTDGSGLAAFLAHPVASSHPYGSNP